MRHTILLISVFAASLLGCDSKEEAVETKDEKAEAKADAQGKAEEKAATKAADEKKAGPAEKADEKK